MQRKLGVRPGLTLAGKARDKPPMPMLSIPAVNTLCGIIATS
jgi:hypothetical protein